MNSNNNINNDDRHDDKRITVNKTIILITPIQIKLNLQIGIFAEFIIKQETNIKLTARAAQEAISPRACAKQNFAH